MAAPNPSGPQKPKDLLPGILDLAGQEVVAIPRYDAGLSAGHGAIIGEDAAPEGFQFIEKDWLRVASASTTENLAVVKVDGDSMQPTLADGDWILVDRGHTHVRRDGVYALAFNGACWIKRLTINFKNKRFQVISDNAVYPMQELTEEELTILGRAVWIVGRKI